MNAQELINEFFVINNAAPPKIKVVNDKKTKPYGWYRQNQRSINVNLPKCSLPVKTPGFRWSYPGYKADLTPIGVIAHETGHFLDTNLNKTGIIDSVEFSKFIKKEAKVSSYEPNDWERLAESIKVFITNPDLLRVGRPKRYEFITRYLKPAHSKSWEEVLQFAHPKIKAAAQAWINKEINK